MGTWAQTVHLRPGAAQNHSIRRFLRLPDSTRLDCGLIVVRDAEDFVADTSLRIQKSRTDHQPENSEGARS
jgi:hypothetical protein